MSRGGNNLVCLSIRQPWAWAILEAGKRVENRTWATRYRGVVGIHAAKGYEPAEFAAASDFIACRCRMEVPPRWNEAYAWGAIIGVANLSGVFEVGRGTPAEYRENPWVEGPFCWVLTGVRRIARPIPLRGQLGLFDAPVRGLVMEQLA